MLLIRNLFVLFTLIQTTACAHSSSDFASFPNLKLEQNIELPGISSNPLEYADSRFRAAGISDTFIASLHREFIDKNPNWKDSASRIIELNVFGFLAHSNYGVHDTPQARKHIRSFLKAHRRAFQSSSEKYHVSPYAIASLLWVETKHGKVMGNSPVAWVYYALTLGAHPDFIKEMLNLLPPKLSAENPKNLSPQEAQNKVIERCKSKSVWAINEMEAVIFIQQAHFFNPLRTRGSFAGAFGLGQFIPSTYLKFSESSYRRKANLFNSSDAILSVAHFLSENGWRDSDIESKTKALYAYNHSKDYGAIILKLADDVKSSKQ